MQSQSQNHSRIAVHTFVASYLFILALLVSQFWWLYYEEIIGKEVGIGGYAAFFLFTALSMSSVALPLAAGLCGAAWYKRTYTVGTEHLKLSRLFVRAAGFAAATFLLAAFVIPVANLKSLAFLYDIRNAEVGQPIQRTDPSFFEDAPMAQNILELYNTKTENDAKTDSLRNTIITVAKANGDNAFKAAFFTDSLLHTFEISKKNITTDAGLQGKYSNDNYNSLLVIYGQDFAILKYKLRQLSQFIAQPYRQATLALLLFISGAFFGILNRRNKLIFLLLGMWFVWLPIVYIGDNYIKNSVYLQHTDTYFAEFASSVLLAIFCIVLYICVNRSLRNKEIISIFDLQKNGEHH